MNTLKKHIINLILLLCTIMCLGLSIGYYNDLKDEKEVVNFYLEDQEYTMANLEQLQNSEESKNDYTGWKQIDDQNISVNELNKNLTVDVMLIHGDSPLVMKGKILFREDKDGCLIDEESAFKLFGSTNVIGNKIVYENRELTIRGVHRGVKNTIVVQMPYNSDLKFDGIAVDSEKNMKTLANTLGINNNGLSTSFYSGIAELFVMIMPILIFIPIVFKILKKAFKEKQMPVRVILYAIVLVVISFVFIKITKMKVSIPYDIIPNKWSDFTYWSSFYEEYLDKFKYILYMKKYNVDIYYLNILGKSIFYSILTVIFFLILRKRIKINNYKECAFTLAVVLLIEFIVFVKINTGDSIYLEGTLFWLIYPYFIILEKWLWPLFCYKLNNDIYLVHNETVIIS